MLKCALLVDASNFVREIQIYGPVLYCNTSPFIFQEEDRSQAGRRHRWCQAKVNLKLNRRVLLASRVSTTTTGSACPKIL